jgi:hypothetical protein
MINPSFPPYAGHNKLSALLGASNFTLTGQARELLARLFDFSIPEGYEDETGFHYAPVRANRSRPPMVGPIWLGEDI